MTSNGFRGGSASCGPPDLLDTVTPKYFKAHNDLKWVPTSGATYSTIPGIIKVQSALLMYVGRINITWNNGTFQQIGKIYQGKLYYNNPALSTEQVHTGNFDVLTCSAATTSTLTISTTLVPTTTTTTITTTTTTLPCG